MWVSEWVSERERKSKEWWESESELAYSFILNRPREVRSVRICWGFVAHTWRSFTTTIANNWKGVGLTNLRATGTHIHTHTNNLFSLFSCSVIYVGLLYCKYPYHSIVSHQTRRVVNNWHVQGFCTFNPSTIIVCHCAMMNAFVMYVPCRILGALLPRLQC